MKCSFMDGGLKSPRQRAVLHATEQRVWAYKSWFHERRRAAYFVTRERDTSPKIGSRGYWREKQLRHAGLVGKVSGDDTAV
jgi:hypothetical protein